MTDEDERQRLVLAMDGGIESIGAARRSTLSFLSRLEPPVDPTTTMDVLLAVSELVTNAVCHAPGPCTLEVAADEAGVLVAVSDGQRTEPVSGPPRPTGQGGLGLHMLTALSGGAGVRTRLREDGKTVSVLVEWGKAGR